MRPIRSCFDADLVIHGKPELLLAAQIVFRRLDRRVSEQELDLMPATSSGLGKSESAASYATRRTAVKQRLIIVWSEPSLVQANSGIEEQPCD